MKEIIIKILAYQRSLAIYYKTAHWQSKGSLFYSDHLLFDRLHNSVQEEIDTVAEKGIGLTSDISVVNPVTHLKLVSEVMEKMPTENNENIDYAKSALSLEKQFLSFLEEVGKEGSLGFQNMVGGIADNHETNVYLLNQRSTK